jgi:hypothetical protein
MDPDQPRIRASMLSRFRQYFNLDKTEKRLVHLLQDFTFGTMASILRDQGLLKDFGANPVA